MQQVINGAATPADARQQRNIKAKSAAEKGSETERVDPRQRIGPLGERNMVFSVSVTLGKEVKRSEMLFDW